MRMVHVSRLGRDVSAIGFGCASLGSRVSPSAGRRAVFEALDCGVTWFDVAPPYGDGQAEDLLGGFLVGRRHDVVICTKFGIARPEIDLVRRIGRGLARHAVALFPGLRARVSKARALGTRNAIRPETIEASVTDSLRRLRTDYVDVLAIHEPAADEADDEAIHSALAVLVQKGYVRAIAIAGSPRVARAAMSAGRAVDILQFPDTPFQNAARELRATIGGTRPVFVTHGVFGSGTLAKIRSLPPATLRELRDLARAHCAGSDDPSADALALFAFDNNPDGVVLASMFSKAHIKRNCFIAAMSPSNLYVDRFLQVVR
jgi:aryl-alcohol dehydrogenase-like predicted oxidoreductase